MRDITEGSAPYLDFTFLNNYTWKKVRVKRKKSSDRKTPEGGEHRSGRPVGALVDRPLLWHRHPHQPHAGLLDHLLIDLVDERLVERSHPLLHRLTAQEPKQHAFGKLREGHHEVEERDPLELDVVRLGPRKAAGHGKHARDETTQHPEIAGYEREEERVSIVSSDFEKLVYGKAKHILDIDEVLFEKFEALVDGRRQIVGNDVCSLTDAVNRRVKDSLRHPPYLLAKSTKPLEFPERCCKTEWIVFSPVSGPGLRHKLRNGCEGQGMLLAKAGLHLVGKIMNGLAQSLRLGYLFGPGMSPGRMRP